ncbi:MAG: redoxin domain-containing protein [Candidatus Eremiobacteraeota bacterium]|nr:redoxin domain-containing protein [Candidatus Eremiobacteraeota bacterium]MBC5802610.1 redoxin domain-containing protein [Candidatus Eremiobacteraeota bacterium]MBC5822681.1 redoxin domain-containing protein [Candidatus Eremiobacteraeota bacterium]
MRSYEQNLARFQAQDAQVLGISIDHTYATAAWSKQLGGITFPLLSDFFPHGAVAQSYGVFRPEGMAERALIVVDKAGIIRYIDVHEISEHPDEEQLFDELRTL